MCGLHAVGAGLDGDQGLMTTGGGRVAAAAWRRSGVRAAALLAAPLGWLGVVYVGSLVVLLIASFWTLDEFSGVLVKSVSFDNFRTIIDQPVYRTIVFRTL